MVKNARPATSLAMLPSSHAGRGITGSLESHNIFTAHVAGNFATIRTSPPLGAREAVAKLPALLTFALSNPKYDCTPASP